MLLSLSIRNLALVTETHLDFRKGLIVLTGETGAGKSIVVNALALVLGERADREYIRYGADKAVIEAEFSVATMPAAYRKEFGVYLVQDVLAVQRELLIDGSSRIRVGGQAVSLNRAKEILSPLAEIVGQHASQMLLDENHHLLFLDRFAGLIELREAVEHRHALWRELADQLKTLVARRDQVAAEKELQIFQRSEIENARISVGEEERLLVERRILDSAQMLAASAQAITGMIAGEQALGDVLRNARKELEKMAAVDPRLQPQLEDCADIAYRLEELTRAMERYGESIPSDPGRLDEINTRLDELYRLKKKYGGSEQNVLDTLARLQKELGGDESVDDQIATLRQETSRLETDYVSGAVELSALRRKAGDYLQRLMQKELADLAIERGTFVAHLEQINDPAGVVVDQSVVRAFPSGLDTCRFLFSANPGEPPRSLVKTASGGELARVLLALKSAERKNASANGGLMVFDEVDTGIGGQTATQVAQKLRRLAERSQVLVITHLHQIARLADQHLVAEKARKSGSRAIIAVRKLDSSEIPGELDRMVALPAETRPRSIGR